MTFWKWLYMVTIEKGFALSSLPYYINFEELLPMAPPFLYSFHIVSIFGLLQTEQAARRWWLLMICLSLLSLMSAAALVICVPFCTRGLFERKCGCPTVPTCPDCGLPYWPKDQYFLTIVKSSAVKTWNFIKMICMCASTAIAAAAIIACGPLICEKLLRCLMKSSKK